MVEWSRALDIRLSDWCCSVSGAGHKAKRLVVHCINGVSSNPAE
jgi:hypothetical protein